MPELTVIIPTHNPLTGHLQRTLAALREQSLDPEHWELLLIDNASTQPFTESLDLSWHPNHRVVREKHLGLTHARICGAREAKGELLVFSDDDTLLDPNYLLFAKERFEALPKMGVAGGRSLPEYERRPATWFVPTLAPLGCRDLGHTERIANWRDDGKRSYPMCAPIGAGMVIRRDVLRTWATLAESDPIREALGRKGAALSSGEDNDINLVALLNNWDVGYFPQLCLTHLVAASRLDAKYLERLAFASSRDWVRVLSLHGVCPWSPIQRWTTPVRKFKAWFACRAWVGPAERIRWHGACGHFEGRASINCT